jgi:Ca-activated chloride channel homolog
MQKLLSVFIVIGLFSQAAAQEVPPALVIRAPDAGSAKDPRKPLLLTKLDIEARIFGFISETKMTMTFKNPYDRQLEGDLYFPLPEGSTVSGYALDINGVMVDGVVVEKKKARVVFEKEIRKGIDPGLVEWVKGAKFKTRVFPIPARGTRTIAVSYVSDLDFDTQGGIYRLPLNFKKKLKEFSVRVEVLQTKQAPRASWSGPAKLNFKKQRMGYFTETRAKNKRLSGQLSIAIPGAHKPQAVVEKNPAGEIHFCVNDFPVDVRKKAKPTSPKPPQRVAVL